MLKMSYTGCPGATPTISAKFTLKMCITAGNCKKSPKTLILKVQGHSRSSTLTPVKSLSILLDKAACLYLSATVFTLYEPITAK